MEARNFLLPLFAFAETRLFLKLNFARLYTVKSVQEDNFENKIVLATKISENCPVRRIYFTNVITSTGVCVYKVQEFFAIVPYSL